ncbi:STAS domain-containing protein [Streptomyces sp. NPDC001205]
MTTGKEAPRVAIASEHTTGSPTVLTFRGELDLDGAADVRRAFDEALELGRPIVVDLSGLTFCDSSGLNLLLTYRPLDELRLVRSTPAVMRVFELTGADTLFAWYDSPDEALKAPPPGE